MPLNAQQVEQKLSQDQTDILALKTQVNSLLSQGNQLQNSINQLKGMVQSLQGQLQSSQKTGGTLSAIVGTLTVSVKAIISGILNLPNLTASRPLKTDSSNNVITGLITLSSTNDVTGVLPIANGGTAAITAAAARTSLNAAVGGQTPNVNGVCGGSQSVTVTGSSFTAPVGGGACSGSFSFTIAGSNFTVNINTTALTN